MLLAGAVCCIVASIALHCRFAKMGEPSRDRGSKIYNEPSHSFIHSRQNQRTDVGYRKICNPSISRILRFLVGIFISLTTYWFLGMKLTTDSEIKQKGSLWYFKLRAVSWNYSWFNMGWNLCFAFSWGIVMQDTFQLQLHLLGIWGGWKRNVDNRYYGRQMRIDFEQFHYGRNNWFKNFPVWSLLVLKFGIVRMLYFDWV